jgi:hypothetical protein
VDDVVLVQIVDGVQNLFDGLGCVLFGELALLADPVEQLSSRRKFSDNVVFVLVNGEISLTRSQGFPAQRKATYP